MIYNLYLMSLFGAMLVSLALMIYLWRRYPAPGAAAAGLTMFGVLIWSFGYVLELNSSDLAGKLFSTDIEYLGIVSIPLAFFVFALQSTGVEKLFTWRRIVLLSVIPTVTLVLAWTNSSHNWMWTGAHLEQSSVFTVVSKSYAGWFWMHTAYSYLLVAIGTVFIVRRLFRPPGLYRDQVMALIICVVVPWVWNVVYVFRITPLPRVDLTPPAFTVSGLAMAWGLFRYKLMEVIPIARDAVIENMSDAIIVLDSQNRLVDLNPAAQTLTGVKANQAIGQPAATIFSGQSELVEFLAGKSDGRSEIALGEGDFTRHFEAAVSRVQAQRGRLSGRVVALHDISERKRAEAERKDLEQKVYLASRMSSVGDLASGIAHEINNPLASVIGYADWLLQKQDLPREVRDDVSVIETAARRMSGILDRLLTFAGQRQLERELVDVRPIVEATLELRGYSLKGNHVQVLTEFDAALPRVMANAGQLQQVFLNLIMNAEAAMKTAHDGGKLVIRTRKAGDIVQMLFIDDGCGMDGDQIKRLFSPFFTTKPVGQGSGLGLSVCYGIVSEHGGRIFADSQPGKGATFTVELPIARDAGLTATAG